ncbi:MAG: carbohydrate ABC transporter permease [Ilumatobacteraceae bacterium]
MAILFLIPFYMLIRNAFTSEAALSSPDWHWLPPNWTFSNFSGLFDNPELPMLRSLVNSAIIAVTQTIGVLVISGMAGYGLARIPYRYSKVVFFVITATLLIPAAVTFVPSFVLVARLGWISTKQGLIVPGLFSAFSTFLFRQNFLSFPRELEEAAQIDGLGIWGTFWRVVVPNSKGFAAAIATLTFIGSWNAFLWPLVVGRDQDAWTVQIALSTFLTAQSVNFAQLFMAALVAIFPLLVMFIFMQRWIIQGVERAGIAGD